MQQIILAAGKFEALRRYFTDIAGVVSLTLGFTGGTSENPTREEVERGGTGHAEAVLIEYDSEVISTKSLIERFFVLINTERVNSGETAVRNNYRPAIFCVTDEQKVIAEAVLAELQPKPNSANLTQIELAGPFYEAQA